MPDNKPHVLHVPSDLEDIFPEFLDNRRKELAAIPDAVKRGDFKQIRIWGHNMAGCGEGYGFPAVSTYGRQLETAALAAEASTIEHCAAELSALIANLEVIYC